MGLAARTWLSFALLAATHGEPMCPVTVSEDEGGVNEKGYVEELLSILTYNGTYPGGKQTALIVFKEELACYAAILLDNGCDGLPENKDRLVDWDSTCLNPDAEYFDAFKLMSGDEQKVYNEIVYSTMSSNYSEGLAVYD